jgi:hypothetical protein
LVVPNAAGFVVGILPVVAWFLYYGLLYDFCDAITQGNRHAFNFLSFEILRTLDFTEFFITLAILGGLLIVSIKPDGPKKSWPLARGLVVAAVLAWTIPLLEPNHYPYNFQAFAMPAAVLGTIAIVKLAESGAQPWWRQVAIVGVVLVFGTERSISRSVFLIQGGVRMEMLDMQFLIDVCKSKDATCVGFAPWHPVFCRDATDVYLNWDLQPILVPWVSEEGKQKYREMWSRVVSQIENKRPVLILDQDIWDIAHENEVISDKQYNRLREIVRSQYDPVQVGYLTVFVRKGVPHPKLSQYPEPKELPTRTPYSGGGP